MPRQRLYLLGVLVLLGVSSRLVPHPPNFTAVGAASVFAGAMLGRGWASMVVPLAAMWLGDAVLGWHSLMPVTHFCVALAVVLGWSLDSGSSPWRFAALGVVSSTLFFLVTNFAVWLWGSLYPATGAGLLLCYVAGLAFYGNMLAGDVLFSLVLVAMVRLAEACSPAFRQERKAMA